MKLLLFGLLMSSYAFSQKVIYDNKDPFNNERNISAGNAVLSPILQATASAKVTDSARIFYISFLVQTIPGTITETTDSSAKECKLKTATGQIFTGKWFGSTQMPIGTKFYKSSTFIVAESDFKTISETEITDVKFDLGTFGIAKNKSGVPKLCKLILDKL